MSWSWCGGRPTSRGRRGRAGRGVQDEPGKNVLFPKRLGVPDELASMVMELVTNKYMNGEVIRVDGGIRMPPE